MFKTLNKGNIVYYARIEDTYFVGEDKKDKRAYLFGYNALGDYVFHDRGEALKKVKNAEKDKVEVSNETYYEEY